MGSKVILLNLLLSYIRWNSSSIRNSSTTQNAKIHSSFSRHVRAMRADGGWLRQSYINAVTQVFYEKKIEEIIEYTNLIGFLKNMKKKYDQN